MKKFSTSITVDYSRTIDEMILASKYSWINPFITGKSFSFPADLKGKKVKVDIRIFRFNSYISSENVIVEMAEFGYRPATLAELLALDDSHFDLESGSSLASLGSVWCTDDGSLVVPLLYFFEKNVRLRLHWFLHFWPHHSYFLGVRK